MARRAPVMGVLRLHRRPHRSQGGRFDSLGGMQASIRVSMFVAISAEAIVARREGHISR